MFYDQANDLNQWAQMSSPPSPLVVANSFYGDILRKHIRNYVLGRSIQVSWYATLESVLSVDSKKTVLEYTYGSKYIMYFQISVVLFNLFIYKYVT